MKLETAIFQLCKPYLRPGADRGWYHWKMPREFPVGITLRGSNQFDRTIDLRDQLSRAALAQPHRRFELTEFYISRWGGIRNNSAAKMQDYASESDGALISMGALGIASWSKALALRAPDTFAIYDARVALSLNALQCINELEHRLMFPMTSSRNTTIRPARACLLRKKWDGRVEGFYERYLELLRSVARRLGADQKRVVRICEVEMCLFAVAEDLARKV